MRALDCGIRTSVAPVLRRTTRARTRSFDRSMSAVHSPSRTMPMARTPLRSLTPAQAAAAARLFSSAVLHEMACKGRSPLFTRLAVESSLAYDRPKSDRVRSVFDTALAVLQEYHRDEYVYKAALTRKIFLSRHKLTTAVMLSEFRVANCKADTVILNGTSTVYEIKSERDNLDRLCNQINAYLQAFARVNVVTSDSHATSVLAIVPARVGVLLLTPRGAISVLRDAQDNIDEIRADIVFDALRLDESSRILRMYGIESPTVPNTERHAAQRELFVRLRPEQVHAGMVSVLKTTRTQRSLADLLEFLPKSLVATATSSPPPQSHWERLRTALETPVALALSWT